MKRRLARATTSRKVIAYCRVSTQDQAESGCSLDAQKARLRALGVAQGRDIDEFIVDDGYSAKTLGRPGMARIMAGLQAGEIAAVVVLKLDRITRSVRDLGALLETFARYDADLISVSESLDTSSAAGRMVVNMLGVVAQWERETIAERTSFALAHKRAQREAYSPTPFGYNRVGTQLVPNADAQAVLQVMIQMDQAGASYRAIATTLERMCVRPQRGKAWYASSVRSILRSRMTASLGA